MKQKSLGIFVVAMVAVLFTSLVSAGDAEWVTDEDQTLGAADVPDGAPMIVLLAHRQPVR